MANEQQLDRWATALAEASILGDVAVRRKYRITERTLRYWRTWLKTRPELRQLYEQKRRLFGSELADDLTARCAGEPVVIVKGFGPHRAPLGGYTLRDLAHAAAAEVDAVAARCGLPPVKAVEQSHKLPSGRRVPLLISHRDRTYSFCAVLAADEEMRHSSEEPRALGHLLYCYEVARTAYRASSSGIRLLALADYDATALWCRAVAHVDVQIGFYNILDVVRGRLASQTSEVAQAAGAPAS